MSSKFIDFFFLNVNTSLRQQVFAVPLRSFNIHQRRIPYHLRKVQQGVNSFRQQVFAVPLGSPICTGTELDISGNATRSSTTMSASINQVAISKVSHLTIPNLHCANVDMLTVSFVLHFHR